MEDICTSARATVHTLKRICSLPLVDRPIGNCKIVSIFLRHIVVAWFSLMDNRKSFVIIVVRMYFLMEFALAETQDIGKIAP